MSKKVIVLKAAKEARENSYAIFSKFKVGAAILTSTGKVYKGTNIESASYGLSMCAERNALFNAYSDGVRKKDIVAMGLVGRSNGNFYPCGACRQVISELIDKDTPIYIQNLSTSSKVIETTPKELMPKAMGPKDIK